MGGVKFRTAKLDGSWKSQDSYFLLKTTAGGKTSYEVGRAMAFLEHEPPGGIRGAPPSADAPSTFFVQAEWLVVPRPSHTSRSGFPMVVMDRCDLHDMSCNMRGPG